ncbi:hypothetical protein N0V82_007040 [Gnomoniopsis sp. IMI 355080]|nr:hypothetical protein N0V82_007040 [Gnomoniopsis sp. IMI 355080]
MSSHHTPSLSSTPNHQRMLWAILTWHSPASIVKTLRCTPNIHSNELHLLCTILINCRFRTPDHLFTKIHTLPSRVAAEMVVGLEQLDIRRPSPSDRVDNGRGSDQTPGSPVSPDCRPLFYTVERGELYSLVQRLFAAGVLGEAADRSKLAQVHDFETLHVLYRLEAEHVRCKRRGDTDLTEPNHQWYHETSDALVAQWTGYLWPLGSHQEAGEGDSVVIKLESFD